MLLDKLSQARQGTPVTITQEDLFENFLSQFDGLCYQNSIADIQSWAATIGLTVAANEDNTYTISKP